MIVGGPGTGKTTDIMADLEGYIQAGVSPGRIALVSFTKKAADNAAERAMTKFNLTRGALPYFRTIHSLAFQECGMTRGDMIGKSNFDELGKLLGLTFSGQTFVEEGVPLGRNDGDKLMFINHLARTRRVSLEEQYHDMNEEINWHQLKQFSDTLIKYKQDTGLIDFTDILEQYLVTGNPVPIDIAFIDEAQDLSNLQWEVAMKAFSEADEIIVAGDDDQAIYKWSGADVNTFLDFTDNRKVLALSHRLPRKIFHFANDISTKISRRIPKVWAPRDDEGIIQWHTSPDDVDLLDGEWLLLARNIHLLSNLEQIAQDQGVPYTSCNRSSIDKKHVAAIQAWEALRKGKRIPYSSVLLVYDYLKVGTGLKRGSKNLGKGITQPDYSITDLQANHGLLTDAIWHEALEGIHVRVREYYLSILRRKGSLTQEPKVHINTIHGVKGGEADKVLLLTDMAKRSFEEYQKNPDDEHRVFYTGATRPRHELHLVMPQTNFYYDF
jgi:superfamily I DNA/RNA helicase